MCVLSNTANLLRATHTAVNPDALLPSDTKQQRQAVQVKHTDLGVPDLSNHVIQCIYRGYYMAAQRYKISLRVLKIEKFRISKRPCNVLFII